MAADYKFLLCVIKPYEILNGGLSSQFLISEADIMSATVLITFGALLGIASGLQLLFIAIVETAVACLNIWLVSDVFKVSNSRENHRNFGTK